MALKIAKVGGELGGSQQKNPYFDRPVSVSSLLNQVLRYERPCPEDLRLLIKRVSANRLAEAKEPKAEEWLAEIDAAIESYETHRGAKKSDSTSPRSVWIEMIRHQESASEIFVLNAVTYNGARIGSHRLREIAFRRLGLCRPKNEATITSPTPQYMLCFDNETRAAGYLRLLYEMATQTREENPAGQPLDPEEAAERIDFLFSSDALRFYACDPALGGIPVIAYEPSTRPLVFLPSFGSDNRPIAYKLENYLAVNWRDQTFLAIRDMPTVGGRIWTSLRPMLVDEARKAMIRRSP